MKNNSRQSFLGKRSDPILKDVRVGIIGLGGSGSHVIQQLAHIGVEHFFLCDPQSIEDTNLNRLVGATQEDVDEKRKKAVIAERTIKNINPRASCVRLERKWQEEAKQLRQCDVIFGCVDSFSARNELERYARRYLMPYFDMGMDVHGGDGTSDRFFITGQAVRSTPDGPCLRCVGVLRDGDIDREERNYGTAGNRPQVVWPNGVLASTAVGLFVEMFTPWHDLPCTTVCMDYDGNSHTIKPRAGGSLDQNECTHYRPDEVGDPFFKD